MRSSHKIISALVVLIVTLGVPVYATAQSDVSERGQVRLAHETEEQLLAMGCKKVSVIDEQALEVARLQGQVAVIPIDAAGQAVAVCEPQIVSKLEPLKEGQVKGSSTLKIITDSLISPVGGILGLFGYGPTDFIVAGASSLGSAAAATANKAAVAGLGQLFEILTEFGMNMFKLLAGLIVPLLTIGSYTSNPGVQKLWPVILGIANLGFLLALMFIALLVTLRFDIGGGVRKLLPRLLLGAVLINFSLVIGGAIIDISRVVMALLSSLFTGGTLNSVLVAELSVSSGFNSISIVPRLLGLHLAGWGVVLGNMFGALLIWLLNIALIVLIVSLVVRYLALVLLLIVSPFAYLALAFPGAQKLAVLWWSNFLKYVAFGPIVLTILLVMTLSAGFIPTNLFDYTSGRGQAAALVLKVMVFSAGLVFAAMAGRYAGIAGSAMALNIVSKGGKKARSMAYRGGLFAGRKTAKGAYTLSGAQRIGREAKAIGSKATAPIRKTLGMGEYSKFDAKTGKLKRGGRTAGGIGEAMERGVGAITPGTGGSKQRQAGRDAKNMRDNIRTPGRISHAALRNETAGARLSGGEVRDMTRNVVASGDRAKMVNLVSNVEIVRKMDNTAQAAVMATGDMEAIKALNASLRKIANET